MVPLPRTLLIAAALVGLPGLALAATGWQTEKDVETPSYAVAEPVSSDLNIDTVVLVCEQGADRRGLQLQLYLTDAGPLAPRRQAALKDDPAVDIVIDGVSHAAELYFADDYVLVADSADGAVPMLSPSLVDALQAGERMELRFDLVQPAPGQAASFDSATVDLKAGQGAKAIAAVRQCSETSNRQIAETPRR
jgi:hypothetical protein